MTLFKLYASTSHGPKVNNGDFKHNTHRCYEQKLWGLSFVLKELRSGITSQINAQNFWEILRQAVSMERRRTLCNVV